MAMQEWTIESIRQGSKQFLQHVGTVDGNVNIINGGANGKSLSMNGNERNKVNLNVGGLERIGIICTIHPISAPFNRYPQRYLNEWNVKPMEYDSTYSLHTIIPFWHNFDETKHMLSLSSGMFFSNINMDEKSDYGDDIDNNGKLGLTRLAKNLKKYEKHFVSAVLSLDSVNHSRDYRQNILDAFLNIECDKLLFQDEESGLDCKSIRIHRNEYRPIDMNEIIKIYSESILCGCIPVIIGADARWLAFQDIIDWKQFSIIINEKDFDPCRVNVDLPLKGSPIKCLWFGCDLLTMIHVLIDQMCHC